MEADPAVSLFGSEEFDLYATLNLDKGVTEEEIKKAYRRAALKSHPDKQPTNASKEDKQAALTRFQQVGYAYAVLSDARRRQRYDDTGMTNEGGLLPEDANAWQEYFEQLWTGQVNASTIDEFFDKYTGTSAFLLSRCWAHVPRFTGSGEEREDVLQAYKDSNGDIEHLLANCMTRDGISAETHLTFIVEAAIKANQLTATDKWKKSAKDKKGKASRARAAKKEAQEAEEMAKDLGVHDKLFLTNGRGKGKKADSDDDKEDGEDALKALIQQRGAQRMQASMAALEAKYGGGEEDSRKKAGKKRQSETATPTTEMSDAEFEALQTKMFGGDSNQKLTNSRDSTSSKRRKAK